MSIRLSWSSASSFLKCQRQFQLAYEERLEKPASSESSAMLLGSHVHAGMEAAMRGYFVGDDITIDHLVLSAKKGIQSYRRTALGPDRKVYNWEAKEFEKDQEYYATMETVYEIALQIVEYQVPRFDFARYMPATLLDLFPEEKAEKVLEFSNGLMSVSSPLIEWKFAIPIERDGLDVVVSGIIDVVLWDYQQKEAVIVDWKTRKAMPDESLVQLDGQMPLYGAVLNMLGAPIRKAVMYNMLSSVPNPVKLTPAKKEISMAAPGSTWEVWSASARSLGEDPEKFREVMEPKMRQPEDFTKPIWVPITTNLVNTSLENMGEVAEAITFARSKSNWPAVLSLSSDTCKFCPFKRVCVAYQNGGDVSDIIDKEYVKRGDWY